MFLRASPLVRFEITSREKKGSVCKPTIRLKAHGNERVSYPSRRAAYIDFFHRSLAQIMQIVRVHGSYIFRRRAKIYIAVYQKPFSMRTSERSEKKFLNFINRLIQRSVVATSISVKNYTYMYLIWVINYQFDKLMLRHTTTNTKVNLSCGNCPPLDSIGTSQRSNMISTCCHIQLFKCDCRYINIELRNLLLRVLGGRKENCSAS